MWENGIQQIVGCGTGVGGGCFFGKRGRANVLVRRVGYLSAAPRVSTHPGAEASGPRAHVLGVIEAFENLGWEVRPFIVGDRLPRSWTGPGTEKALASSAWRRVTADLLRVAMGAINTRQAWRELGGRVDWVYERFAVLQSLGWIFKRAGVPWILETNAPLFHEAKVDRQTLAFANLARRREIWAYQNCDALVCVSEALKEIVMAEAKLPPSKVLVMSNGVDTNVFDPSKYPAKRFYSKVVLGFVGALTAWQGLDLLVECMADLQAHDVELALVVVGDGPMRRSLEARVRNLGLAERVRFTGRVNAQDVPTYISGFDLGYSGQIPLKHGEMYLSPLKLYEYMAMAKPVVASAFEDARRVVKEGETGFLFQPGSREDLKRALLTAYRLRERLPEMGRKARTLVVNEHSWVARVRNMIHGVDRIVSSRF